MPDDKYEQIWTEVWNKVVADNIGADQINAFFSRLHPQAFSEGFFMLTAENAFIKNWVEANYTQHIKRALEEIYNKPFTVAIEVDTTLPVAQATVLPQSQTPATPATTTYQYQPQPISQPQPIQEITHTEEETTPSQNSLASEYRFDNFVVGSSNRLAYSMALAVAETPGQDALNPLFLYGRSGVGKTHLLRAIQNYVAINIPSFKTVYVDTMELVNDYTSASMNKSFNEFKKRYNEADMVFIDDVQSLQGKEGSINVVFQLFNNMLDSGKQIVFSADRAPKHIDIDERMQTRFNSGGTCDIQPPETETKLGIIRNYIEDIKNKGGFTLEIDHEIQNYIAQNSSSNIRELKSAITKIFYYGQTLGKSSVTLDEVSQILRDHFSGGAMKKLTVAEIQRAVEKYFNISHADLVGKKRSADISHARQVGIYLSRMLIDIPLASIGKEFNRDHSTVMYAITQIETKCKESRDMDEELEIIKKMIMDQ